MLLLNWAAPGAYRTQVQKWQREVLGDALVQVPGAMGVLLSPVYYHKKGNLWACEQAHVQMLRAECIHTVRTAALLFEGRRDGRNSRPQPRWATLRLLAAGGRPCGFCHRWSPLRLLPLVVARAACWVRCVEPTWGGGWRGLGAFVVVFENRLARARVATTGARRGRA